MTWPNFISLCRLLCAPIIAWLIIKEAMSLTLVIFILACLSDAIDGLAARHFRTKSRLGLYLDPIADKCLLATLYVTLGMQKYISPMVVWCVVGRDLGIALGWSYLYFSEKPRESGPLLISKINTMIQMIFIVFVLGTMNHIWHGNLLLRPAESIVIFFTVASGIAYLIQVLTLRSTSHKTYVIPKMNGNVEF